MTSFPLIVTALALLLQQAPEPTSAPNVTRVDEVPVLMYHVVADPPPRAPWPHLYVSPAELEAQVAWLERRGFVGVTLSDVWDNWHHGGRLPPRPVVLTFDDGYRSVATRALPILRRRGWPAVLNLKVGNLEPGSFTDAHVRKLLDAGWELGAHTLTHPDLRTLDDAALEREVAGSRAEIAKRFGVPVAFFCYPAGRYDRRVIAAVRRAGFLGATTTLEGLATPRAPFELRRIRVDRGDGVRGLARRVWRKGARLSHSFAKPPNALRARSEAWRGSARPAPESDSPA